MLPCLAILTMVWKKNEPSNSVLVADIRCFFHCLMPWNILRGHCRYIERDSKGRVLVLAAVTGSLYRDTIHYEKVFYGGPVDPTANPWRKHEDYLKEAFCSPTYAAQFVVDCYRAGGIEISPGPSFSPTQLADYFQECRNPATPSSVLPD